MYINTAAECVIEDDKLGRRIHIAKSGSLSTVVWTPWTEKADKMGDHGPAGRLARNAVCRIGECDRQCGECCSRNAAHADRRISCRTDVGFRTRDPVSRILNLNLVTGRVLSPATLSAADTPGQFELRTT